MIKRARAIAEQGATAEGPTVVTTCPDCGTVRVPARSVVVLVENGSRRVVRATFACPECRRRTTHRLEPMILGGLRALGAPFRLLTRPAEADEIHDGPPLTAEDVDDFCVAMEDPAWPRLP
jgi:hypothetical protein